MLLNVDIGSDGLPTIVRLHRTSGHPSLDESAIAAVRKWTFEPEQLSGQTVPSRAIVPIRFALRDE